jgi:hypothetical protein
MSIGFGLNGLMVDEYEQVSCTIGDGLRVVPDAIG